MKLSEAKAVITGGASGLGRAVAQAIVEAGARVAVLDIEPKTNHQVNRLIGKEILYIVTDVTSETAVDEAMQEVLETLEGITLTANCAGVAHSQRVVGRDVLMSPSDFARVLKVNLLGTFIVCRAVANIMQHNSPTSDGERGVIINTASIAAYDGQVGQSAYAASKGGVASLTLPLAREFASFGVRVMAIAPGLFNTPMLAGLPDKVRSVMGQAVPFPPRLGDPREFAELVCHIYQNPMLNGETIRLDGALRMPPK